MFKKILRIVIALIFIASGFVKAVDLVGFSFKLEEYFSPSVFNIVFFENLALPIAAAVVALELFLGMMLLLKIRMKITLFALISLCIFFAFLTFYSAYFNKVTDCGCFGDAIKFTPWQSFGKDIILLFGLLVLWILYRKDRKNYLETGYGRIPVLMIFSLLMMLVMYWGIKHEPLIDFRSYKIGTNINSEKQKITKNPSEYKTFYSLKNSKTNEVLIVNQDDYVNDKKYWEEGSPWKIEEGKNESKLVKKGYESEVSKFKLEDENGNEVTEQILKEPSVVLIFEYKHNQDKKNDVLSLEHSLKNKKIYGVSTIKNAFENIPNLMMDGTAIKTIARSNPFVLVLENGKIVDKESVEDYLHH